MTYQLSDRSRRRLTTCHPKLQLVVEEAAREFPMLVLWGWRGEKDQNDAFDRGATPLRFPDSKHNLKPSRAVDCAPDPLDWNDLAAFDAMGEAMLAAAKKLGIAIVWGKTFKRVDRPHFELAEHEA